MTEKIDVITLDDSNDESVILLESEADNDDDDDDIFNEDWNNFRHPTNRNDSSVTVSDFFLITELNRLVPYLESNSVKFHPMNMPNVKIGKIEVIGFVTSVKEMANSFEFLIEDGTGALTISYDNKYYSLDKEKRHNIFQKYQTYAHNIDSILSRSTAEDSKAFPNIRPGLKYPPGTSLKHMAILEHRWWQDTQKGLLGKTIAPNDYISAFGYCAFDFQFGKKPQEEITFQHLCTSKLYFHATKVECIREKEYNARIKQWISISAKKRYKTKTS